MFPRENKIAFWGFYDKIRSLSGTNKKGRLIACNLTYIHIKWHYCWLGRSILKELLLTNTFASVSHANSFSLFAGLFPEMTTAFILNAISTTQGPIFFRTFGAEGVTALNTGGTLVLINHTSAIVTAHHLIASVWNKRYTGNLQIIMSTLMWTQTLMCCAALTQTGI